MPKIRGRTRACAHLCYSAKQRSFFATKHEHHAHGGEWHTLRKLVLTIAFVLAAAALALAVIGLRRMEPPIPNGWLLEAMPPPMGPLTREALLLTQGYHLALGVLWLTAASLAAGLVVGMAVQRRAGLWAAVAVAGSLGVMLALGGRPAPAPVYRPLLAAGGLLVLVAATLGGWIGHSLGHET